MAKLIIDQELCEGCESCVELCPDSIEMGPDDKAHVTKDDCEDCDCEEVVGICPVEAISIED